MAAVAESQHMLQLEVESQTSHRTIRSSDASAAKRNVASYAIAQEDCYGSLYPVAIEGEGRADFVRKVDAILGFQMLIPVVICVGGMQVDHLGDFFISCTSYAGGYGFFVLALCALCCLQAHRASHPKNYQLLVVFTVLASFNIAAYCAMHQEREGMLVLAFFAMTSMTLGLVSAYAFYLGSDFSWSSGLTLMAALSASAGILSFLRGFSVDILFPIFGSFVFCACILYEMSRLLHIYGPDDAMRVAVEIYLDALNSFCCVLRGLSRGDN